MQANSLKKKNSISNVEFLKFDLVKDSFENLGKHDLLISTGVLHHTGNIEKVLGNLHHLSTPYSNLFLGLYHLYKRAPFLEEFASSKKKVSFKAYGISANDTDPREKILVDLLKKVENLEKKIKTLNNKKVTRNIIQKNK